jgi:hypothetical protein
LDSFHLAYAFNDNQKVRHMMKRFASHAGIAIGPILMVIALIAVIVGAMSMGSGDIGGAMNADRVTADLRGQIDMIRTKVGECVFLTRRETNPQFAYPADSTLSTPALVKDLECPRDPAGQRNLWGGARPANLPAPPIGFDDWVYVNHGDPASINPGGTCIYIQPTTAQASNSRIREGIQKALMRFATSEYEYDPNSVNQRIVVWIRRPQTGTAC